MKVLDPYVLVARVFPAIIAGLPAIAFISIFVSWGSLGLPHLIATSALGFLLFAFADIARRRAHAIQPHIFDKMGGIPSTTMLRHRDETFGAREKKRFHDFLAQKLKVPAPSLEEENTEPEAADAYYSRCATWLRENTRDTKKFQVLFNENVTYGFRRNLLALKAPGLFLNAGTVIACVTLFWYRYPIDFTSSFNQKVLAVIIVAALHAAYLATFVSEAGVFDAARIYARQLLLSCETEHLRKATAPKATKTSGKKGAAPVVTTKPYGD
jgi:hypothetical protein